MKLTDASRNLQADAVGTAFDGGTGILEFRTGAMPTNAGDALTGTVVATVTVPSDSFGAASAGAVAKAGTWEDTSADASGTVGYAVLRLSGDTTNADNTVRRILFTTTVTSGGGEIELQNLSINATQSVTITSFTITQPAS